MHTARRRAEWERTASVLCMLYSVNRGKGPARTLADFMPADLRPERSAAAQTKRSLELAKMLFGGASAKGGKTC